MIKMRNLLLALMLAVVATAMLSAKSYSVQVSETSKAGDAVLKAGDYKVEVDGSKVVFTNTKNRERTETSAVIKESDQKFDTTVVRTSMAGGTKKITEIGLGGTKTRIEFQ